MAAQDVVIAFIAPLGIILNTLVIASFLKRWKKVKPLQVILMSLAMTDIAASLTGLPMELSDDRGIVCKAAAYLVSTFSLISISHIVALCMERMITMKFPLKSSVFFATKIKSLLFIIPSWLYGTFWGTFPWLGWGAYSIESYTRHRCSIDLRNRSLPVQSYNYSLLVFCYIIPIVAVVICFVIIKREMRRMLQFAESVTGKDSTSAKAAVRAERSFTFVVLVMLISFLFAWTPYALCVFYVTIHGNVSSNKLDAASYLGKSSCVFNPIIYVFMYKEFRIALRKLFNIRNHRVSATSAWSKNHVSITVNEQSDRKSATLRTPQANKIHNHDLLEVNL